MENIPSSNWPKEFGNQRRTPKSASNVEIDANRPERSYYVGACKNYQSGAFYTQKDMSALRFEEEVANSLRKRGEKSFELHAYMVHR